MTPPPLGFKRRVLAVVVRTLTKAFYWTYRIRFVAGADVIERIVAVEQPVIFCMWHDGIFIWPSFFHRLHRRGVPLTIFTSRSRDGELIARLALAWGADVVRGSSSRGGTEALRLLLRAATTGGSSPVMIPDGPRGPRREAKSGTVVLARMSGRPVVPMGCAARGWQLPTWDRLLVPRPFTTVTLVVGEPRTIDRDADIEEERLLLKRTLDELNAQAKAAL